MPLCLSEGVLGMRRGCDGEKEGDEVVECNDKEARVSRKAVVTKGKIAV